MGFYSCPHTYIDDRICGKGCYRPEGCHIHWKMRPRIPCDECGMPTASSYVNYAESSSESNIDSDYGEKSERAKRRSTRSLNDSSNHFPEPTYSSENENDESESETIVFELDELKKWIESQSRNKVVNTNPYVVKKSILVGPFHPHYMKLAMGLDYNFVSNDESDLGRKASHIERRIATGTQVKNYGRRADPSFKQADYHSLEKAAGPYPYQAPAAGPHRFHYLDPFFKPLFCGGLKNYKLDKERTNYGMKEMVIAKTYIDVLALNKFSDDAQKLLHWRTPNESQNKTAGDFALIAYEVIAPRSTVTGRNTMTIEDVNNQLDILNAAKLKMGMSEKTIFSFCHPDALDLFNVCSDLRKVFTDLKNPNDRLPSSGITVFHPFKPMLSKPVAIQEILKLMGGNFWIEEKIDELYNRRANQYTYLYGNNKDEGSLTPHIYNQFHPRVNEIILDGEMVNWDPTTEVFKPFGTLKAAGKDIVFDIILVNGRQLIDQKLEKRREYLRSFVTSKPYHIIILDHKIGSSMKDLTDAIDEAVMKRQEGIIVKKPSSTYVLNERINEWIKVKPEYLDTLGDDLDLIVVGANYGAGRRGNMFGSFMCALRDLNSSSSDGQIRFLSFCRFGTGFSMKEADELKALKGWERFDPNDAPSWLIVGRDKPHMIIRPEMSVVVQIRASEIIPTGSFACGYTLRFPRFEKVRFNKDWESSMTFEEMMNLRRFAAGRLQSKKVTDDDLLTTARAIRRGKTGRSLRGKGTSILETFSNHIMIPKFQNYSKLDLERIIKEHGGRFFQHHEAQPNMYILADTTSNLRIRNLIEREKYDIIKPQWVLDCIDVMEVIPLGPKYMLFTTQETAQEFLTRMDESGDSYTDPVNSETLKEIFDGMEMQKEINLYHESYLRLVNEIEEKYFDDGGLPNSLFRNLVVFIEYLPFKQYLDGEESKDSLWALREGCRDRLKYVEMILRYNGAQISNDYSINITHVIFDNQDLSRVNTEKEFFQRYVLLD
ncbi:13142_t:CDS:10 [Entrophospora sp. SA101]|nr:13142_t:CDS:10 [Entrophospora sp. SA101]